MRRRLALLFCGLIIGIAAQSLVQDGMGAERWVAFERAHWSPAERTIPQAIGLLFGAVLLAAVVESSERDRLKREKTLEAMATVLCCARGRWSLAPSGEDRAAASRLLAGEQPDSPEETAALRVAEACGWRVR